MTDKEIGYSVIDHCRKELGLDNVSISITHTSINDWGDDCAIAYLNDLDYVNGIQYWEIELIKSLTLQEYIRAICHECAHIMQRERGDVFNYDLPYHKQPHELEAIKLEYKLYDSFMKG